MPSAETDQPCEACGGAIDSDNCGQLVRSYGDIRVTWQLCRGCTTDLINRVHLTAKSRGVEA